MRIVTEEATCRVMVGSKRVVDLDFADDEALLLHSLIVMEAIVLMKKHVTQKLGINMKAPKCEILLIGRGEGDVRKQDWQLKGQPMKQVEEFTLVQVSQARQK